MKKTVVILAVALMSVMAQANLITANPDFSTDVAYTWVGTGGGSSGMIPGWSDYVQHTECADGVLMLGYTNGMVIYQDSGHVALADTVYTLTARVQSRSEQGGQAAGVIVILQGLDGGWGDIYRETFWFSDYGVEFGTSSDWMEFSISIDTSAIAGVAGYTLKPAVALAQRNTEANPWHDYGNLYIDSMTLVPEPATLVLLGLGGLLSLKKRKA